MPITLRVREKSTKPWLQNFSQNAWKIRHNNTWLQMAPYNTKVRSADGTTWEDVK